MSAYPTARRGHILELQSLRGIAASVVLLYHASFFFDTTPAFHDWAEILFNAHAAVMLFFVLSGYVLGRALSGTVIDSKNVLKFYAARMFRIYPMAWVACLAACLYLIFLHNNVATNGASQWYASFWQRPFDFETYLWGLFTFKPVILPPIWSIRIELLGSLAIPFIVLAGRGGAIWLLGATSVLSLWYPSTGTLYLPSFILGVLAFRFQDQLGRYLGTVPVLIASTMVLLFFRRINPNWRFDANFSASVPVLIESVSAAILIIGLVNRTWMPLRCRAAIRLGDISYSLYLVHFIIIAIIAKAISRWQVAGDYRAIALIVSTIVLTLPIASFTYERIEKPGIVIGKKIVDAFLSHAIRFRLHLKEQ